MLGLLRLSRKKPWALSAILPLEGPAARKEVECRTSGALLATGCPVLLPSLEPAELCSSRLPALGQPGGEA